MLLSEGAVVWWLENNIFPFCCVDHLSLLFQCLCDMFAHLEVIMWLPSQLSTPNDRTVVFMWHRIFIFLIPLELLCSQYHPRYYKSVFPNLTSTECQLLYLFSAQLSPPGCHRKRLTSLSGQQAGFKRPEINFWIVSHASYKMIWEDLVNNIFIF